MKEKNIQELAVRMGLVTVEDMCQYTVTQLVVKIANKVNEIVNGVWQFETDVQEVLKTQNDNIQYLLGEGLHLEVENIFDGWINDGTFDTLINQSALNKVNARIDATNAQLSKIENKKADKSQIGSPLVAASVSGMKDTTKVYVNTSDGHWYYYNGSAWADGGVYNSQGVGNKSITPEKTSFYELHESPNLFNKRTVVKGKQLGTSMDETTDYGSRSISAPMEITPTKSITVYFNQPLELIVFYDQHGKRLGGFSYKQFQLIGGGYSVAFTHGTAIQYIMCQFNNELALSSPNYCDIEIMTITLDGIPSAYIPYGVDIPFLSGRRIALSQELRDGLPNTKESNTCSFFGAQAGESNVESTTNDDGRYNTAVGVRAMQQNTTGDHNTACGFQSLMKNTTGDYNTAYGEDTLYENTTGGNNTAVGIRTMQNNLTGDRNTVVGGSSLYNNTTGSMNTVLGQNAAQAVTNKDGNTCIGYSSNVGADTENAIVIGRSSVNEESNTALIGNTSTTKLKTYGDFHCLTNGGGLVLKDENGVEYKLTVSVNGELQITRV